MELKEFISETIKQITDGIRDGQKYIDENDFGEGVKDDKGKEISFDVAISTDKTEVAGAGGKISIASVFSAGVEGKEESKNANLSRIQFKLFLKINAK
jgi:hypothetical protein